MKCIVQQTFYNTFSGCIEGEVRLVNGKTKLEGTVEVCHNDLWGLISDERWDTEDATVVCKQLGLPSKGEWHRQSHLDLQLSIIGPI